MSPDGRPDFHASWTESLLVRTTQFVLRHSFPSSLFALALTGGSIWLALNFLGYKAGRNDLVNPKSEYFQRFQDYLTEFGEEDDVVIVVEGRNSSAVKGTMEELAHEISSRPKFFHEVFYKINLSSLKSKGLHYASEEDVATLNEFLKDFQESMRRGPEAMNVSAMLYGLSSRLVQAQKRGDPVPTDAVASLEKLSEGLRRALKERGHYISPWPELKASREDEGEKGMLLPVEGGARYLSTEDGKTGYVLLQIKKEKDNFSGATEEIDLLRELTAASASRHPEVKIGLTGLPVMENDEMRSSQNSMLLASVISFVGVGIIFAAGFGGLRHAAFANVALLAGMAWAFAYAVLSVGHLNIFSITFTVTLIGVGIDYGVYYVSRYIQCRKTIQSVPIALLLTTRSVGPAILTGAITTAVVFFAAGFTTFRGVSELGIIAGGGILLCAAAELYILPLIIQAADRSFWGKHLPSPVPVDRWLEPLWNNPLKTMFGCLAVTVVLGLGVRDLWYDYNLLNLQADGLESVALEKKMLESSNRNVWYAVSMAGSREELMTRKKEFQSLGSIQHVEEIASLLPETSPTHRSLVQAISEALEKIPTSPRGDIPPPAAEELSQVIGQVKQMLAQGDYGSLIGDNLSEVQKSLAKLNRRQVEDRLGIFQNYAMRDLFNQLAKLREVSDPDPPRREDLPRELVKRFIGANGQMLIKVFGRGDIWDMDNLKSFVEDIRSVDPLVTGHPIQAYEASREMKESYEQAALYSLFIVLGVLLLDFRSVGLSFLAALPLGLGLLQTFGLMGLLDLPLNPANMIALPLLLGIGIDYGVHIVHDFKSQTGAYRMSSSTAIALLVDALTTIVGFGSMMIADHKGLQSLGRVLTLGITFSLVTSILFLPALLTLFTRHKAEIPPIEEVLQEPVLPSTPEMSQPRRLDAVQALFGTDD